MTGQMSGSMRRVVGLGTLAALGVLSALLLCSCGKKPATPEPVVRSVRSVVVKKQDIGDPIVVTGHLRARNEVNLAFRLSGKLVKRVVDVGDTVTSGQTVAVLDAEVERNTRNAAQADLFAAEAALEQSEASERRQRELLSRQVIAREEYDLSLRQLKTTKAQVVAAQAKLKSAEELLGYTDLQAESAGVVTTKGAEPGEVVQAGQMILTVAQENGRDAVFGMPAQLIRDGLALGQEAEVWLADNPSLRTNGKVREISPQADPVTRNYQVKVEMPNPPAEMFLGATVVGRVELRSEPVIEIPSQTLTMVNNKPAIWVVDPKDNCVHLREITVTRYTPDSVLVTGGLEPGEVVVSAGVQELREGQEVKLLGDSQ